MFESVLVDQNPHWDGAVYPEGVPRLVMDDVKNHLDLPHILSFVGVRRAGKSTLMRQMINHLIRERSVLPRRDGSSSFSTRCSSSRTGRSLSSPATKGETSNSW